MASNTLNDKKIRRKKQSQIAQIFSRLVKNKAALVGLIIFTVEVLLAVLAPLIIPYDYSSMNPVDRFMAPCVEHLFGTDNMGRDLFSRVIYGARYSLSIGIISTLASVFMGMVVGAVAGYFGGQVDNIIMRTLDVIQAIPALLLTIVIAAVLGQGAVVTIIAMAVGGIAGNARLFRASILNVRTQEYIEASRSINCSSFRIILHHIVPNALSPMIVSTTMSIAGSIVTAASLSFMGLGVQPPTPEWGALLSAGRADMRQYPYLVLFPGLAIMVTVLCLNLLGDGLRDALDPKLKD